VPSALIDPSCCWVLDLDGVVWLGATAIDGSVEAVGWLRARGHRVTFCSNNSSHTTDEYIERLGRVGITATAADIISSANAVATLVEPAERVLVVASGGVTEAVSGRGAFCVDPRTVDLESPSALADIDAVVVGFHSEFDYQSMTAALRAVEGGARLLGANSDPVYPTEFGPSPGCGALLASIEVATGVSATVAGKPHGPMVDLVRERWGDHGFMVGDSPGTDGALADALGWSFGLVQSGNTAPAEAERLVSERPPTQPSWFTGERLESLVDDMSTGPARPGTPKGPSQ